MLLLFIIVIGLNIAQKRNGITVAGGNEPGESSNQLSSPHGLCIDDDDQTIVIADHLNDRIVQWKIGNKKGQVVAGGNGYGGLLSQVELPHNVIIDKKTNSLIIFDVVHHRIVRWSRRIGTKHGELLMHNISGFGFTMDDQRYLYICDWDEVRRYQLGENMQTGTVVAGGNGTGSGLNQLNAPKYLFVDQQQNIYVSDDENHRVVKWNKDAKEGIIVAGGQGPGDSLTQLSSPRGIFVDQFGTVYVVEAGNNCVTRWSVGAKQGTVIVGQAAKLSSPEGICFDRKGNFYVADTENHRIQRFSI